MSPRVQWQQSYIADDVDAVIEHARRGAFPADSVAHVSSVIDPGAGKLSAEDLAATTKTSNDVLAGMAGRAQWVHSYVTDDAITPPRAASPSPRSARSAP